jgi:ABC-type uncharacterized transport system ATPase component
VNTAVEQVKPAGQDARPVYVLEGVSKLFAKRNIQALDRIDLALREGSFSSVIGASGCGKSTLLKIMAGRSEQTRSTGSLSPFSIASMHAATRFRIWASIGTFSVARSEGSGTMSQELGGRRRRRNGNPSVSYRPRDHEARRLDVR